MAVHDQLYSKTR